MTKRNIPVVPSPLTPYDLAAQIARVAFADIRRLFNPDGTLKPIAELDDEIAAALSIEIEEGPAKRTAKLRIDRMAALSLLCKYMPAEGQQVEDDLVADFERIRAEQDAERR